MVFSSDPVYRAAISACFAVPVAWAVCRVFRELPRRVHCWVWRMAYAKILVSTLAVPPISIPLIPHSMAETRAERGRFELAASLESWNKEIRDTVGIDRSSVAVDLARDGQSSMLQVTKSFLRLLWLTVFGWLLMRSLREWFLCRKVRRRAEACNDEDVCRTYREVSKQLRVSRNPPLLLSSDVSTPALVGLFAPAVVVPQKILSKLSRSQIRCVISHELAHFVRRDLIWSLLPRLVHCVLFFHPLIWFAGRRWHLAQESACDALVLQNQPLDVADYAEALITTTQFHSQSGKSIPFMGVAATSSFRDLKERLTVMQFAKPQSRHVMRLILGMVFGLGIVGVVPWKLVAVRGAEDTHRKSEIETHHDLLKEGVQYVNSQSEPVSESPFWTAVCSNDIETARQLLDKDSSLASRDFRPEADRDPHTEGYPLYKACAAGHAEMAKLLLDHGADIDAKSPTERQKELGMPIWWAVDRRDYSLANHLLDRGADVGAFAWANATMVDRLYEYAVQDGAPVEVVRKGFSRYLGKSDEAPVSADAPESVKLLDRVLSLGGQPTMGMIVEANYYALVEELLQTCPEMPGTRHDTPQGTVFECLCNASSWTGHPKVMEMAMTHCPELHSPTHAKHAIARAIISHNRFGTVDDYYRLIETQLKYLEEQGALASSIQDDTLLPHHKTAKHYLWPNHYGYGESQSSVETMIELTELFIRFGFDDLHRADADGKTPLMLALERTEHPGLDQYVAYLNSRKNQ